MNPLFLSAAVERVNKEGSAESLSENAFHQVTRKHNACLRLFSPDTVLGRMSQILRITCCRIIVCILLSVIMYLPHILVLVDLR